MIEPTKATSSELVRGIDVSYHQGEIDWVKVAKQFRFAFIRTSDSLTKADPRFLSNWEGAWIAGVRRGAYIYFRPGQSAVDQAEDMVGRIKLAGGLRDHDLPPVLDLERDDGLSRNQVLSKAKAFIEVIENDLNRTPIVYSYPYFIDKFAPDLWRYPLWIADYDSSPPRMPTDWAKWHFWQHSDRGAVPGIQGRVDLNVFDGSVKDLAAFAQSTCLHPLRNSILMNLRHRARLRFHRFVGR